MKPGQSLTTLLRGLCHVDCSISTDEPFRALTALDPYLERDAQEELFRQVRERSLP